MKDEQSQDITGQFEERLYQRQSAKPVTIDDLLNKSIKSLLLQESILDDPFGQGFALPDWLSMLEKEIIRVRHAAYADEGRREDRIGKINAKIKEMQAECLKEVRELLSPAVQSNEGVEPYPKPAKSNDADKETSFKEMKWKKETTGTVLLVYAIKEMEERDGKTPEAYELANYVLSGVFKHSNISEPCVHDTNGELDLISNRYLFLTNGAKLTKKAIVRSYNQVIYPKNNNEKIRKDTIR